MKARIRGLLLLLLSGTLVVSCSSGQDTADTSDVSRSLLAEPVGDGRSTPLAEDGSGPEEGLTVSLTELGVNRGDVEAPVKVIELSDYGCGYCRQFHEETFPVLLAEFIETGMVEWKFVPFVTGMFDHSPAATEAAECALAQDVESFEGMNRRIWSDQAEWKRGTAPEAVLRVWATGLGMDITAYDACIAGGERGDRIRASRALASQVGVRGTPTFVVLGYPPIQGALPLDAFRRILTAVHEQAVADGR